MNQEFYDGSYYLDGVKSGKSNYENYRWLPDLTLGMAKYLAKYLNIGADDTVLDFGCARGYTVKALHELGFPAQGYDISEWAIANCDESIKNFVSNDFSVVEYGYDFILAKDVFEHIDKEALDVLVPKLVKSASKCLFIIVPLTKDTGGKYVCYRDEQDSSHVIRWNTEDWLSYLYNLCGNSRKVSVSHIVPELKPMSKEFPFSYGFFKIENI